MGIEMVWVLNEKWGLPNGTHVREDLLLGKGECTGWLGGSTYPKRGGPTSEYERK